MDELNFDTMTSTEMQTYLDNLRLLLAEEQEKGKRLAEEVARQVNACWDIFNES